MTPTSFESPTYTQKVTDVAFTFSPEPSKRENTVDDKGNRILKVVWKPPLKPVTTKIQLTTLNKVSLEPLKTNAAFPTQKKWSQVIQPYLKATDQVKADDQQIKAKARELTADAKNQFDAVQRVLTWVIDHMHNSFLY